MRKLIITNVVVILLIIGIVGGLYYYFWDQSTYITTDDAQVSGKLVTITPQIPGKLTKWSVNTGDKVTAGQVIGVEDNTYAVAQYRQLHPGQDVPADVTNQGNIASPINGTIVQTTPVAEGQTVAPGQPLATVVDLSHLTIVANVEETNYQDVKVGNSVDIFIDATPGTKYSGTVQSIGIATAGEQSLLPASNVSGSFTKTVQRVPVSIAFSSDTSGLKPGMNATVKIHR